MTIKQRLFTTSFTKVYPCFVAKAETKWQAKTEADAVICWRTGYTPRQLAAQLKKHTDCENHFQQAPRMNPARSQINGVVCSVRVETIQEPTRRETCFPDKLVDELARGKASDKVLRG